MAIIIKAGVDLKGLHPIMRHAKHEAAAVYDRFDYDAWITSGLEGEHSPGSFHPFGLALDFGFRNRHGQRIATDERRAIWHELDQALPDFDVVLEPTHIHVEPSPALERQLGFALPRE